MPHLGALVAARGLSKASRGFSAKQVVTNINLPNSKHPIRRSITTLLPANELANLSLNEPDCQNCGTARVSDNQRFCHHCGAKLVDTSTYSHCLQLPITVVPTLTKWQKDRMVEHNLKTIGDILTLQDPGGHLRKIHWVGVTRAGEMVTAIKNYVDEFLS